MKRMVAMLLVILMFITIAGCKIVPKPLEIVNDEKPANSVKQHEIVIIDKENDAEPVPEEPEPEPVEPEPVPEEPVVEEDCIVGEVALEIDKPAYAEILVSVNGEAIGGYQSELLVPSGAEVTLKTNDLPEYFSFVGWENEDGSTVGGEKETRFVIRSDTRLTAAYETNRTSDRTLVRFMAFGRIEKDVYMGRDDVFMFSDIPSSPLTLTGFEFTGGWVLEKNGKLYDDMRKLCEDVNDMLYRQDIITFIAQYKPATEKGFDSDWLYTVLVTDNVSNNKRELDFRESQWFSVTAEPEKNGLSFDHWEFEGQLISYQRVLWFRVFCDCELKAIYYDPAPETIYISNADVETKRDYDGYGLESYIKWHIVVHLDVPEGKTVSGVYLRLRDDHGMGNDHAMTLDPETGEYTRDLGEGVVLLQTTFLVRPIAYFTDGTKVEGRTVPINPPTPYNHDERATATILRSDPVLNGLDTVVRTIVYFSVPDDATDIEAGMIAVRDLQVLNTSSAVVTLRSGPNRLDAEPNFPQLFTAIKVKDEELYYTYHRAFLTYTDGAGVQHTVYSKTVYYNWDRDSLTLP